MESFPLSLNDIFYGGIVPVLAAVVVFFVVRKILPTEYGDRYAGSTAILCGFLLAYGLTDVGPWIPTSSWHWLTYATMVAAILGPVASASSMHFVERALVYIVLGSIASWFLVPTWDTLEPSRITHLTLFTAMIVLLSLCLQLLEKRIEGPLIPTVLWMTMSAACVVLICSGSLRFTQIALAGASAIFGVALVCFVTKSENCTKGITPLFAVMLVGILHIGYVNSFSEIPAVSYFLVAIAPLLLWLATLKTFLRFSRTKQFFIGLIFPGILLAIAVIITLIADSNTEGGY